MESPIRFINELSTFDLMAQQQGYADRAAEQALYSAIFKKENDNKYSGPALAILQNGEVIFQESMPVIFDPMPEIKKIESELSRYTIARDRKAAELEKFRSEERYSEIEQAAKYHREYSAKVEALTIRLKNLKAEAPAKIEKSISEIQAFMKKLDDAKNDVNKYLEAAKELKKQYEAKE